MIIHPTHVESALATDEGAVQLSKHAWKSLENTNFNEFANIYDDDFVSEKCTVLFLGNVSRDRETFNEAHD